MRKLEEYKCQCGGTVFKLVKLTEKDKEYTNDKYQFRCEKCNKVIDLDENNRILQTFRKTKKQLQDVEDTFNEDIEQLEKCLKALEPIKTNITQLEHLLRELKFIYFEESGEIPNNIKSIASIINKNLPYGHNGKYDETSDSDIKRYIVYNEHEKQIYSFEVGYNNNKNIQVSIKDKDKRVKPWIFEITDSFRVIQVLLRINEKFNYSN